MTGDGKDGGRAARRAGGPAWQALAVDRDGDVWARCPCGDDSWGCLTDPGLDDEDGASLERLYGPVTAFSPGPAFPAGLLEVVRRADAFLDAPPGRPPGYEDEMANHWRRIVKVCSEAGEVMDALAAVTGENCRKGTCGTWEDVIEELGDTFMAALCAIQHLTKDEHATWAAFLCAVGKAEGRLQPGGAWDAYCLPEGPGGD